MKNAFKVALLIVALCIGVFTLMPRKAAAEYAGGSGLAASPRSLFLQNCARCHGADGKAQTKLGRKLEADDLTTSEVKEMSAERIARFITRGRLDMPAFGKKLTTRQITSIARYVRTL